MNKASKFHQQAMALAEQGDLARRQKAHAQAKELFQKAFDLERQAAVCYVDQIDTEPTRSVLLRSAASLALNCGEFREAEKMIGAALSGDPPEEICQELREALIQVANHQSAKPQPAAKVDRQRKKRRPQSGARLALLNALAKKFRKPLVDSPSASAGEASKLMIPRGVKRRNYPIKGAISPTVVKTKQEFYELGRFGKKLTKRPKWKVEGIELGAVQRRRKNDTD